MLTPKQLDHYPDNLVELWAQTEQAIIADMVRRINGFDLFIPSAQWQLAKVKEMGQVEEYILQELAAQSYRTQDELRALMEKAGLKTLAFDDRIYEASGLTPVALKDSPALQAVIMAGLDKTNGLFRNLTNSAAAAGSRQFERALDLAYMQVTTGAFSHTEAIKHAIKQLSRGGLEAVVYNSGRVEHLDVAVRRAVLTGVNQTAAKLQIARADEMGCDLVEVTAHAGARPSHAAWQGGIYSRSGKSDQYENFEYATGYGTGAGLCGWNCRHSFFPYFEGISRPAYTKEELEQFNAKNYEYNGVRMTEYEATQKQRYMERQIRRWKREEQAMKAAKLPTGEAKAKIAHWNAVQKDFLGKTGLKRQYDREWVAKVSQEIPNIKFSGLSRNTERLYSKQEIDEIAKMMNEVANKHTKNVSKWNGTMIIDNDHNPGKLWDCSIRTPEITSPHAILHELLHAHSISYYTMQDYVKYAKIEEASVQLLNIEICKKEGIELMESYYDDMIQSLREINKIAHLQGDDYEFAVRLLNTPLTERVEWLNEQMNTQLGLTIAERVKLQEILETFEENR